jgi:AcrR family transcriptional regulator
MSIPSQPQVSWRQLDAEGKRAFLMRVAGEVFSRDGLEAPMPAVAEAAGVGVASVYRQFPSKRDLLAAIVVERVQEVEGDALEALNGEAAPREALFRLLRDYVARQAEDDLVGEVMACVDEHPDVVQALAGSTAALEALLDAAKPEGLREDASVLDLRVLFAATRAAGKLDPGARERAFELWMDAVLGPGAGS